ncbi:replication-relaxation family protein [Nocardia sp. CC201C]|uniref:replication-relaxation family protein n=1 Tax=Nocardia sp. CC201C TaxID=3044575 RepID=UPI0024A8A665|nr:replication-relaxation family protein [Nocardia sp. CC201C]
MPRRRVSRRDLEAIADSLTERQWAVLRSVADHRFLTVDMIRRLHFAALSPASSSRLTQKALHRLRRDRLLGTLDRRIGGGARGSSALVHYIDVVGYRLLDRQDGPTIRRHVKEPTETFLRHTLAVAETHLRLVEANRRDQLELVHVEVEPRCWRGYTALGGTRWVKPDLYAETTIRRGSEDVDGWFIEVDLGSESIPRLLKKCHDYQAYERTGIEQYGGDDPIAPQPFPAVIWTLTHRNLATAERRRRALRAAIAHDPRLDDALFHVIAPDQFITHITNGGHL